MLRIAQASFSFERLLSAQEHIWPNDSLFDFSIWHDLLLAWWFWLNTLNVAWAVVERFVLNESFTVLFLCKWGLLLNHSAAWIVKPVVRCNILFTVIELFTCLVSYMDVRGLDTLSTISKLIVILSSLCSSTSHISIHWSRCERILLRANVLVVKAHNVRWLLNFFLFFVMGGCLNKLGMILCRAVTLHLIWTTWMMHHK